MRLTVPRTENPACDQQAGFPNFIVPDSIPTPEAINAKYT